ncbi:MAG TPA: methyltransferase domain-containing protein [Acetobacteraceae bacterium]|nr:methyltransferase domain-containing protein [Acetobacteraceae bacterium]
MSDLQFRTTAAAGYDQAVGHWTRRLIPSLLRAARLASGQRVVDIASGTGLAAEAAAAIVGPSGHVVATDISPAMLELAHERLSGLSNASCAREDGQFLTFPDESFDVVICNMGLMYFPAPARGLSEFHRALRRGGRAAVSVYAGPADFSLTPGRTLVGGVLGAIARRVPSRAAEIQELFFFGRDQRLDALFEGAGFKNIEAFTEILRYTLPSFTGYFADIERGAGNTGQEYTALPDEVRHSVREQVRREIGDGDGPVEVAVPIRFASGWK